MKFLSILFLIASFLANAQERYTIIGNVSELKTNIPLPFVNVYIEGTSIGIQTNQKGGFSLNNISKGNHRLVASMVGFEPFVQNISILDKNINLQILLKEDIKALNEVKVVGVRDKVWEKHYKQFVREFLGNNYNAKEVKILNKEVLDFDIKEKSFTAQAIQPLVIENLTLGYKISYILQSFEKKGGSTAYKGLAKYDFIETQNEKQKAYWEKNRIESYQGSVKHFLNAVINNRLKEEGFKAFLLNPDSTHSSKTPTYTELKINDILSYTTIPDEYKLTLNKSIMIVYENDHIIPQFSKITQLSKIIVNKRGDLFDPYSVSVSGDIGEKRFANLLPTDFELSEERIAIKSPNLPQLPQLPQKIKILTQFSREIISIEGIHPYYLAGETIRLKTFVAERRLKASLSQNTEESIPSQLSVPLYVEFIDIMQRKLLNRFTLKLEAGKADLTFPTTLELPTGNYQIRAYTNWMRNFSQEGFFKQNCTVFSQNYKKEMPIFSTKPILDTLIIHVEGGHLVDNLKSKIAIETKNSFGEKISIPFCMLNSKNDTLTNSQTDSTGIAVFDLLPKSDEVYRITAKNKDFILPSSLPQGTILTVDNLSSKEKLRVFIQTNEISNDTLTLVLLNEGQVVYWKNFQNNKQSLLINIPKNNLYGKINCFLLDKGGNELGERMIEVYPSEITIDNLDKDKRLLTQPLSHFLYVDSSLKYSREKGLTLRGRIIRSDGKENRKEIKLSMVLSSIKNDTAKQNVQTFFAEAQSQFIFQNIDFFGKMKATFIAPNSKVILDTLVEMPPIHSYKLPINWQILRKNETSAELDKRKEKILLENIRKEKENIILDEVVVTAKKIDPNAINGISPNIVLDEKRIINQPTMSGLLYMLIPPRKNRFGTGLKVFIDTQELRQAEIDNIDFDITPSIVEKILIFEEIIPAIYGRAACAIVIILRRGASRENTQLNETFIVKGYHKNK